MVLCAALAVAGRPAAAPERFTPGHVFVSYPAWICCGCSDVYDRIYECDPETWECWLFVELPEEDCGGLSGLAFRADGKRLRASQPLAFRVLEFSPDGSYEIVLDISDGILCSLGNSFLFDADNNFYFADSCWDQVLKFPGGYGPAIFLTQDAGNMEVCTGMTMTSNGDLYLSEHMYDEALRFPPTSGAVFADYGGVSPWGITSDSANHLFVLTEGGGLYRYEAGRPNTVVQYPISLLGTDTSMAISPDETTLYVAGGFNVQTTDIATGVHRIVAAPDDNTLIQGIAAAPFPAGDFNFDTLVELTDCAQMSDCLRGPESAIVCIGTDTDRDRDVDLRDFARLQNAFTGETP